jgi:hypothetical protein
MAEFMCEQLKTEKNIRNFKPSLLFRKFMFFFIVHSNTIIQYKQM